jgi:2-isopropylmalate synthase
VVFNTDEDGVVAMAVKGASLIRELAERERTERGTHIRYEYSPENFSESDLDLSIRVCAAVLDELSATPQDPVILNLPSTVECSTPNCYADQVEYFCRRLPGLSRAIISLHPHNDRGTAVAAAELAMLAGAQRIEGTLFGNGERTGNVDLVTLALNLYTQGIAPGLDFHRMGKIRETYERTTKMQVPPRHPYAGDLVFTAFSGSHQDAINKGETYRKIHGDAAWEIPYLPIDPADLGREYEPIIRINSQSGKGGAAFVMSSRFGYNLPKKMHPEFGRIVKAECDRVGREISPEDVMKLFRNEYISVSGPYKLLNNKFLDDGDSVTFKGTVQYKEEEPAGISGTGNGPIDAFFSALAAVGIQGYSFEDYSEHAISIGSNAKAVSYIQLASPNGDTLFGVGISHNINYASIRGVLCAINRSLK